jgi:alkylation response protein AidB-like acyl-CoA dehydrogenase
MDFRFGEEEEALRETVAAMCGRHFDLEKVAGREDRPLDADTWAVLADIGILGMLAPAQPGGSGTVAAAIAFEVLGAHLATGPMRWTTIAAPLVPDAARGAVRVTGIDLTASRTPHVVEHAAECDLVLIVDDHGVRSVAADELPPPLTGDPLDPLTPALAYTELPAGASVGGADVSARLRRTGTVLTAAELVGVAQGALDVAGAYAKERHQFGVPIGSFQAVKHLLADMYVRVGLARAATYAAAAIVDDRSIGDPVAAASTAKLLAGEAGLANGRAAVQILGGMGFTWEMLPHYFLKRAWVLDAGFGTGDTHALSLADSLVSADAPVLA